MTEVNTWLANLTADAVIRASCNIDMDNIARKARGEPPHPVLDTYRQIGPSSPALAKPWQSKAALERRFEALKAKLEDLVEGLVEATRRCGCAVVSA